MNIVFLGGGKMAEAIVAGLLRDGADFENNILKECLGFHLSWQTPINLNT